MTDRVRLIRRATFASGHRYWREDLDADANRRIFGNWAAPYNHGHNYTLACTVEGSMDPRAQWVVDIKEIDRELKARVVALYDQKSINDQVPGFETRAPTMENILLDIGRRLSGLHPKVALVRLELQETPRLKAELDMNKPTEIVLTRTYEFAAAHRLHVPTLSEQENRDLFGKCNNPMGHGHNYLLEVSVEGKPDPESGMAVDLAELDRIVNAEIVDRYDHKSLNDDVPEFAGRNPSSEVVTQEIFRRLDAALPWTLVRVRLHETARNAFEVGR